MPKRILRGSLNKSESDIHQQNFEVQCGNLKKTRKGKARWTPQTIAQLLNQKQFKCSHLVWDCEGGRGNGGGMTQQLRSLSTLAESMSVFPALPRWLTAACHSSCRDFTLSSDFHGHQLYTWFYIQTYRHSQLHIKQQQKS